jgi:hypothetical protein
MMKISVTGTNKSFVGKEIFSCFVVTVVMQSFVDLCLSWLPQGLLQVH